MIALLSHPKSIVVRQSLEVLAAIGPEAKAAVPHIKSLLETNDERIRPAAETALAAIAKADGCGTTGASTPTR